jgi:lipoprotein-anchoring transpeptidase ErfK/SrfK
VNTAYAVQAFEKSVGLPRDGRATPAVTSRLATATLEKPLVHGGPPTRVEIDISRQILFLYEGGSLSEILPVSTGSGRPFCVKGLCGDATTPTGSFKVNYQKQGWDLSPLGRLYNPLYFNGGIAIHGFPSVPTTPASHGCVRIPMAAAEWFPDRAPVGTPVFVV